jgi:8-oxo-dGTP pyrophosphatase MutT (NUDIX family)
MVGPAFHHRLFMSVVQRRHRWLRAMTLGARVAVFDPAGRVLLVRHTYSPGWIFPGGGVETGESCEEAALRELREEAGITALAPLQLHGIFSNHASFNGDHLAFYVLREFSRGDWKPGFEIAAAEFFATDALPDGVTSGSLRRIAEITSGMKPDLRW